MSYYELLCKVNAKENPWTVNSQYRKWRRTSQKTEVKKKGRKEDQDGEDQRETSKLIAYLSTKSENCKIVRENAMLCQIGVFKISIDWSLNIIHISAKFMCNKLIPY